jgi:hypothetical protein
LKIAPATVADATELAPILRAEDVEEIRAASGEQPLAALLDSVALSEESYSVRDEQGIVALFGVGYGAVWLLGSDRMFKYPKALIQLSREWLDRWHDQHGKLYAFVDSRNTSHIKFLDHLGVSWVGEAVMNDVLFKEFNYVPSGRARVRRNRPLDRLASRGVRGSESAS